MREKQVSQERYVIRSVTRALQVLDLFIDGEEELSVTEISNNLNLSQSTVYRLVATLSSLGYTDQNPGSGKYRLGPTCLALGDAFLRHRDLANLSAPTMRWLRDKTGETLHLGTLINGDVIYIAKLPGLHPIGFMTSKIGGRAPLHCTALGKAMLSALTKEEFNELMNGRELRRFTQNTITNFEDLRNEISVMRQQGYALDNEENEEGVTCIAAPIYDQRGLSGAISISGPSNRIYEKISRNQLAETIQQAANEISERMGQKPNNN